MGDRDRHLEWSRQPVRRLTKFSLLRAADLIAIFDEHFAVPFRLTAQELRLRVAGT